MKRAAILFGLNYDATPSARLRGCVNDVRNMKDYLVSERGFSDGDVAVYTDDREPGDCTAEGIVRNLWDFAISCNSRGVDMAYIHYSGHGCGAADLDGDEGDGQDECLVPSDFRRAGVVRDDVVKRVLRTFAPGTKVTCVFDCCHSGTIADLRWSIGPDGEERSESVPRRGGQPGCEADVLMISGCADDQTSADAFNVNGRYKYSGALTSVLLQVIGEPPLALACLRSLRSRLAQKGFDQVPQLSSSRPVDEQTSLFV